MDKQYNNISNEAVKGATGKSWEEWFALLDEVGAEELPHKEIARLLLDQGYLNKEDEWWAQAVTVGYEYARERRVKGQTADAGFQVGVQKTVSVAAERLWQFLTSPAGLQVWLGSGIHHLTLEKGAAYRTDDGVSGEIRSVYPGEKLRLTWQPDGWENQSTLQLYLQAKGSQTTLRFHHEKLNGSTQRRQMKAHWQNVLEQINRLTEQ